MSKSRQKVQCLLIATSISLEIWVLIKSQSIKLNIDSLTKVDKLFRKQEANICFFDFINVNAEFKIDPSKYSIFNKPKESQYLESSNHEFKLDDGT